MATEFRQGKGTFNAGSTPTDYSLSVVRAEFVFDTTSDTIPATLGNDEEDEVGNARKRYLEIDYLESSAADGFAAEAETAYESLSQELEVEYLAEPGAAGVDNPQRAATVRVTNVGVGKKVGTIRLRTARWPVVAGTYAKTTA